MKLSNFFTVIAAAVFMAACNGPETKDFIRVDGENLKDASGNVFVIRGTNLGNWLNPEGYLFQFPKSANSANRINDGLCQMVGPAYMEEFWARFRENYVTEDDIAFIASTGATTVRIPFHYKIFTDEDYLGMKSASEGFALMDRVIGWCREHGLRVILDMHDCPGGQTGDNIDDSYGYPWLFRSERMQEKFIDVWVSIAGHYAGETAVLGYDLMNEPIAHYFEDKEELNAVLPQLMERTVAAIREVDKKHIMILAGAQWNTNFKVYESWDFDDNIMFTCHIYKCPPSANSLKGFTSFRDKTGLPMYMGETGENTDEWVESFRTALEGANIGWTFWTYKKLDSTTSFASIPKPEGWEGIQEFLKADRSEYALIREARGDQAEYRKSLDEYLENCLFTNCDINEGYISALGLDPGK